MSKCLSSFIRNSCVIICLLGHDKITHIHASLLRNIILQNQILQLKNPICAT